MTNSEGGSSLSPEDLDQGLDGLRTMRCDFLDLTLSILSCQFHIETLVIYKLSNFSSKRSYYTEHLY